MRICKRRMCAVWSSESIGSLSVEFLADSGEIVFRKYDVRIENDYIFSLRTFHAIVAALSRTAVAFCVVVDVKTLLILLAHFAARHGRTVLNYNHLKVMCGLFGEAVKKFVHFVGTVVYRNDEAVFHVGVKNKKVKGRK